MPNCWPSAVTMSAPYRPRPRARQGSPGPRGSRTCRRSRAPRPPARHRLERTKEIRLLDDGAGDVLAGDGRRHRHRPGRAARGRGTSSRSTSTGRHRRRHLDWDAGRQPARGEIRRVRRGLAVAPTPSRWLAQRFIQSSAGQGPGLRGPCRRAASSCSRGGGGGEKRTLASNGRCATTHKDRPSMPCA